MENTLFYLSTCKTCQRIMDEVGVADTDLKQQDIKKESFTEAQVDELAELAGSYEAIFTRRSRQYRALGLHELELTEADYKKYLLEHYSFLKRPVFVIDGEAFVGNAKKTVEAVAQKLS
ncbi:MAG: ArsC/Spx/MgsR family protein [Bacteroidota bacterium]